MPALIRSACPACATPDAPVLLSGLDLTSPVFRNYFQAFYPPSVVVCLERMSTPPLELRACGECGTVFHGSIPAPAILNEFYAALQSATFAPAPAVNAALQEQRFLELMMVVRFLDFTERPPDMLDFGTGDGSWARLAAAAGCRVSATDTAKDSFALLASAGVSCIAPDRLPPASFDFINVEQVFEHLPDPFAVLVSLHAALRPGGILKIGVPHDPLLREKLRAPDWSAPKHSPASLNSVAPVEHLNAFTPEGLASLGRRIGLLPMNIEGWHLLDPRRPHHPGLRARLVGRLRDRLGVRYRPPYSLAQTRFFLRPV